jgi:hypothetical protein
MLAKPLPVTNGGSFGGVAQIQRNIFFRHGTSPACWFS